MAAYAVAMPGLDSYSTGALGIEKFRLRLSVLLLKLGTKFVALLPMGSLLPGSICFAGGLDIVL